MRANPRYLPSLLVLAISTPALAQTIVPASSADWMVDCASSLSTGNQVGLVGDINGDGFDDVLIGEPVFDGVETETGRISLYLGSAGGVSTAASWRLEGTTAFERVGGYRAIGDVNADGFDDFVVVEGGFMQIREMSLFLGSAGGPVATSWSAVGESLESGDINGDGINDLVVRRSQTLFEIYLGAAAGPESTPSTSLSIPPADREYAVQDVNGDGYADLTYLYRACQSQSKPGCNNPTSNLSVHLGSASGLEPQPRRTVAFASDDQARWVSPAGDLNGDGFGDLAVLLHGIEQRVTYGLVFYGSRSGFRPRPDTVLQAPIGRVVTEGEGIGGAGDMNGDGFNDLFVAMYEPGSLDPSLLVFHGGPTGVSTTPSTIIQSVELPPSRFAFSMLSGSGDVNGDGFGDLMTSTRFPGFAYLFHGSASF